MIKLHPQLQQDTLFLIDWKLCQVLLMNDQTYPWLILVPKKQNLEEWFQLNDAEQIQLTKEINQAAKIIKNTFNADKINIAALGNVVNQLHVHIIGRFKNDATWPKPVWGNSPIKPYSANVLEERIKVLTTALQKEF